MSRKVKIVADSSADLKSIELVPFASAPLTVRTQDREFVDDDTLDINEMVEYLKTYKGKSSTACPNTEDYLGAFGDAEEVFCITITATLSGSYNAAVLAKRAYEEQYPDRRVFVLNSLSTGPEMALIIDKIQQCIQRDMSFEDICTAVTEYSKKTGLLFMLESITNLANNGRVSPIVAKMAGFLGIRMVGKASDRGDLEPLNKCRGEKKAIETIFAQLEALGYRGGRVNIAHCLNEDAAKELSSLIKSKYPTAKVKYYLTGGLCAFYAEKGGMLIGFEKA